MARTMVEEGLREGGPYNSPKDGYFLRCNIVLHLKDPKFLAHELSMLPPSDPLSAPGFLNPADSQSSGIGTIGMYWEMGRGANYVGEEDWAATSTGVLGAYEISRKAIGLCDVALVLHDGSSLRVSRVDGPKRVKFDDVKVGMAVKIIPPSMERGSVQGRSYLQGRVKFKAEFSVGDRVRFRNKGEQQWLHGEVSEVVGGRPKILDQGDCFWEDIERDHDYYYYSLKKNDKRKDNSYISICWDDVGDAHTSPVSEQRIPKDWWDDDMGGRPITADLTPCLCTFQADPDNDKTFEVFGPFLRITRERGKKAISFYNNLEKRWDADFVAKELREFVLKYGGTEEEPPSEWAGATPRQSGEDAAKKEWRLDDLPESLLVDMLDPLKDLAPWVNVGKGPVGSMDRARKYWEDEGGEGYVGRGAASPRRRRRGS